MKEELLYNERRIWAKGLYVKEDKCVKDIALEVNTDEATVRHWIAEGAWDGIRRSLLISKKAQLDRLYDILEELNTREQTNPKNVDLIFKYTGMIKNLETETTVSDIVEVAEQFILWLRRKDIALTKKVTLQFDAFIKQKLAA